MYTSNPEIDAVRHADRLEQEGEARDAMLEEAARDLTEATLEAMREGPTSPIRGTSLNAKTIAMAISAGEAIYEVHQLKDGGDVIDAAICYLAKSTDPVAQAHAKKIAELFANNHFGM